MTAQVPPIADRDDLTVSPPPAPATAHAACFFPGPATIEIDGAHLSVDPATADPARPSDRERYPAAVGRHRPRVRPCRAHQLEPPPRHPPAWADAARLLEESRIEPAQVTRRPGDRRWLRACTRNLVVGDFTAAAAPPAHPRTPAQPPR